MTQSDITPRTTVLLTGPTRGIGAAVLHALLARPEPLHLVLLGRPSARLRAAVEAASRAGAPVQAVPVELGDLDSVRAAVAEVTDLVATGTVPRPDAVLLNAGAQHDDRRRRSAQDLEATFAVNVVAQHVLLSGLEALLAPAAHVVLLGSSTHRGRRASFGLVPDPDWQPPEVLATPDDGPARSSALERHRGGVAYATSKLALVTLSHPWARRLGAAGHRLNVYDPGLVAGTGLGRDMPTYRYLVWRWLMPAMSVLPGATTPARTARHAVSLLLGEREPALTDGYVEMGRVTAAEPVTFDAGRQDVLWSWLEDRTRRDRRGDEPDPGHLGRELGV
jgi:NAD(P)-dependent dehydrogenase (short-subunit alcohol dehydrogenase family)